MRILIFSDIHCSVKNLKQFLLKDSCFDLFLFAGDCFGYLTQIKDVISFLENNKIEMILGNHDLYYLKNISNDNFEKHYNEFTSQMIPLKEYDDKYGKLFQTCKLLKYNDISFLYGIPLIKSIVIENLRFTLCHGSPEDPVSAYVYEDNPDINKIFTNNNFDVLILGHTHKPFIIENNGRFIVNPGSCSLPRGGLNPSIIICETNPLSFTKIEIKQFIKYRKVTLSKLEEID